MTTQSVGQASYNLLKKPPEKINVIDMQREMQKSVSSELEDLIKKNKDVKGEYYILHMVQRERLMSNVIRNKFISRLSRPLPDYDCSLFSYDNKTDVFKYHWTIPDEGTCEYMLHNKSEIPERELTLLSFIEQFANGTLV